MEREQAKIAIDEVLRFAEDSEWRMVLEMLRKLSDRLSENPADIHNNYH